MRIYVGNLSYDTTEDELRKDFSAFGEVASVSVVTDRYSGRSKGFAFVEMTNKAEADAAIAGLNGKSVKDRTLVVNEARPRTEGGSSGGSRGGYGGVLHRAMELLRFRLLRWSGVLSDDAHPARRKLDEFANRPRLLRTAGRCIAGDLCLAQLRARIGG